MKKINRPKKINKPLIHVSDFDDDNENSDSTKDSDGGIYHLSDKSGSGTPGNNNQIALVLRYKIFCVDPSSASYKLNVNVENEGNLLIKLFVIVEDSEDPASISAASLNGDTLTLYNDLIGPLYVKKGNNRL